ncbi:MAG: 4-(cytidine 5'-diphospho)-2-C-methyl-D-erythritol kinase [Betaproteobacteria bacterium]|nr:4-(cytidine 5'-diphospho)-2-C-methyl-D-erythritol kinase [Betaproteobacteria bacterium]
MTRYPAPAKLNLFLHVVGRRADGYHLLETVFRFLDVGDELEITPRVDGAICLHAPLPGVPPEQDLCARAAILLQAHTRCRLGADIRLIKRLPLGGGLGGGSSDAATVLLALNRLWSLHRSRAELQALGLKLGADVPVFIYGQTAFAQGVGEALSPCAPAPAAYVVLTPRVHVSTPAVFSHPGLTRDTPSVKIAPLSDGARTGFFGNDRFRNDLQSVVSAQFPEVAEALVWLGRYGEARMTGSGACVFAPFADRAAAEAVFRQRPEHLNGFVADGVDQHPLIDYAG